MISKRRIGEKVHQLKDLERQLEDLTTQIDILKDELKAELLCRKVSEIVGDDWKISFTRYESRRFDQSAFKEVHPELYEQFKSVTESHRFSVK